MLKNLVNLPYFFKEVFFNMKRNLLMTVASASTVMILSLILGFFIIAVMNLNYLSERIVKDIQIVAYIRNGISKSDMKLLQNKIAVIKDVTDVKFISKDEALKNMRKKMGASLELEDIGENPLPDSFEIKIADYDKITEVADKIKLNSEIEDVKYGEDITKNLLSINKAVKTGGTLIILALMAATVFIVSNTIRITVYARRREIAVMQLVGATNWFIRWPFVLEGILYGFFGAISALIILSIAYSNFIPHILQALPFLTLVKPENLTFRLFFILMITGIFVGTVGSWISANKYLKNFISRSKYNV